MPTIPFCSLDDVYADWNFKKPNQVPQLRKFGEPEPEPGHEPDHKPIIQRQQKVQEQEQEDVYLPSNNGLNSFCPNCQNCVRANDVLQQRIIEQNIWPRPRWEPQYPHAYTPYDPFNRYWMNNVPQSHISGREDFGNGGIFESPKGNTETLLQLILFILIALFVIQLVECLYMRVTE